jgi:hypothetical protein
MQRVYMILIGSVNIFNLVLYLSIQLQWMRNGWVCLRSGDGWSKRAFKNAARTTSWTVSGNYGTTRLPHLDQTSHSPLLVLVNRVDLPQHSLQLPDSFIFLGEDALLICSYLKLSEPQRDGLPNCDARSEHRDSQRAVGMYMHLLAETRFE